MSRISIKKVPSNVRALYSLSARVGVRVWGDIFPQDFMKTDLAPLFGSHPKGTPMKRDKSSNTPEFNKKVKVRREKAKFDAKNKKRNRKNK